MLQHEFEDLIGRKVELEEYVRANGIYMTVNVDKETFCKEWDTIKDSKVFADLDDRFDVVSDKKAQKSKVAESAAALILDALNAEGNDDLLDKRFINAARLLIGEKAVTKYRVEHDYELDARDKTLIKELLAQ